MREQRVVLEHDPQIAGSRRPAGHGLAGQMDRAGRRFEKAGNQLQQRRLAAAGRPDDGAELAGLDRERNALDAPRAGAVTIGEIFDRDAHAAATRPATAEPAAPRTAKTSSTMVPAQAKPVAP